MEPETQAPALELSLVPAARACPESSPATPRLFRCLTELKGRVAHMSGVVECMSPGLGLGASSSSRPWAASYRSKRQAALREGGEIPGVWRLNTSQDMSQRGA